MEITSGYFWPQKAFFVPVVDSEVDVEVSAVTGRISHLDEHLQRQTNGPTRLHCLINKRTRSQITRPVLLQRH